MSWFSFYLLCGGIGYISRVIWPKENLNKYKDVETKVVIMDVIYRILTDMILNYVAWFFLKNSLPEFIELAKGLLLK